MDKKLKVVLLQLLMPIVAILFSVLLSSILILAIGKNPVEVYLVMLEFCFGRTDSVGAILFNATPLILAGLAVAVGFKVGLFNIGVEGQYFIGTLAAAFVAFSLKGLPMIIHLPLTILAAAAGGMLWAMIPIYLKVKRNVHEVISTIMLNYVAYSLVHYFIADVFIDRTQRTADGAANLLIRTPMFPDSVMLPKLHGLLALVGIELPQYIYLNWFFIVSLVLAVAVYYLLWHTPLGYEIRVVGENQHAAEAAGIKLKRTYIKGFLISGALAGLVGLSHLLSYYGYMDLDFPKNFGFNGIAVALMGNNNPLGIVLSAGLFGFLNQGAEGVQTFLSVPMEIIAIMQGIIILSVVVASQVLGRYIRRIEKKEA